MADQKPPLIAPSPCPTAHDISQAVRAGQSRAEDEAASALSRIEQTEAAIGAWHYLDRDRALANARTVDTASADGLLAGVPVGIKDIVDTADQPTENGNAVEVGRHPTADATAVARLRAAGAVVLGKTVTTECAAGSSGKTCNPHDVTRTPGGSSSGSAAAVAAGMVPLALGTQTAGSVIRPATYCGVWAMKPSLGVIPCTGVLRLSHTLDHMGFFARSPEDLALAIDAVSGDDGQDEISAGQRPTRLAAALKLPLGRPRFAFLRGPSWDEMDRDCAERYDALAADLGAEAIEMGPPLDGIVDAHQTVMLREIGHYFGQRYGHALERLSPSLRERIVLGQSIGLERYFDALEEIVRMRAAFRDILGDFDAALTAPAPSEAPKGLDHTGSRNFTLPWTVLGAPAVNVPGLTGPNALPLGIQVVGTRGSDAETLRAAAWLGQHTGAA